MKHCKAKTQSGKPCKMRPIKGSDYCFNHDPAAAAQRAVARKRGGESRHNPHAGDLNTIPERISNIQDVRRILDYVRNELLTLENSIGRNRELRALSETYMRSFEIGELEERIAALEERFNANK